MPNNKYVRELGVIEGALKLTHETSLMYNFEISKFNAVALVRDNAIVNIVLVVTYRYKTIHVLSP